MWKIHLTVSTISLLWALVQADYTITASNELGSYHYPAPPKSQQLREPAVAQPTAFSAAQAYQNQYQVNYYSPAFVQQASVINKRFTSPALDNAAFNLALNSQGYTYDKPAALNAALTANSRSSKPTLRTAAPSVSTPVIGSLNVKLPVPIGVTPLNIAPLPLQPGTPYIKIARGVTSYGTLYPQRRRR